MYLTQSSRLLPLVPLVAGLWRGQGQDGQAQGRRQVQVFGRCFGSRRERLLHPFRQVSESRSGVSRGAKRRVRIKNTRLGQRE